MVNFNSRAEQVLLLLNSPLALKILLELYPSKKYNAERLSQALKINIESIHSTFSELEKLNMITDNPSSGNKILTEEGRFFLEQTATLYPNLNGFLEEQAKLAVAH